MESVGAYGRMQLLAGRVLPSQPRMDLRLVAMRIEERRPLCPRAGHRLTSVIV